MSTEQTIPCRIVQKEGKDYVELFPDGGSETKYVTMEEYREIVNEVTQFAETRIKADQAWREKQQTQK